MTSMPSSARSLDSDRGAIEGACPSCDQRSLRESPLPGALLRAQAVAVVGALTLASVLPAGALAFDHHRDAVESTSTQGDDTPDLGAPTEELPDAGGAPDESGDASPEPTVPVQDGSAPAGSAPASPPETGWGRARAGDARRAGVRAGARVHAGACVRDRRRGSRSPGSRWPGSRCVRPSDAACDGRARLTAGRDR